MLETGQRQHYPCLRQREVENESLVKIQRCLRHRCLENANTASALFDTDQSLF
jgi:hypothetical protein